MILDLVVDLLQRREIMEAGARGGFPPGWSEATTEARFLHWTLAGEALPASWSYPGLTPAPGFQILSDPSDAIQILDEGHHRTDDWYSRAAYPHLAFLRVTGKRGDRRGLPYFVVLPEDVQALRVLSAEEAADIVFMHKSEAGLRRAIDLSREGYSKLLAALVRRAETKQIRFVNTLSDGLV